MSNHNKNNVAMENSLRGGDSNFNPPSCNNRILVELEADFEKEGKHTVRECLRSRRGVLHSKVAALIERSATTHGLLSLDQLSVAHDILLKGEGYMDGFQNFQTEAPTSSLGHLSRIATLIRFLQLLLEVRSNRPLTERPGGGNNAGTISPPSLLAAQTQIDKMVASLLQRFSRLISEGMNKWREEMPTRLSTTAENETDDDPMTSDVSTTFDMRHLVCFSFSSLVKLNHYAKSRIALMGPLWKSICDIASSSCSHNTSGIAHTTGDGARSLLSLELVEEAIAALSPSLLEGEQQIRSYSVQFVESRSSPVSVQQQINQAKLLKFLVARITALLQTASCCPTAAVTITDRNEGYSVTDRIIQVLLRLKGLATTIELLIIDRSRTLAGCSTKVVAFLQPYVDLSDKAESSFLSLMMVQDSPNEKRSKIQSLLHRAMINTVLDQALADFGSAKTTTMDAISQLSLYLGRAMVLQRLLVTVVDKGTSNSFSDDDVESILVVCESLVCSCLPQCHAPLMLAAIPDSDNFSMAPPVSKVTVVSLISDTLKAMSTIITQVESKAPCMDAWKRAQLHRLLIRWLAPSSTAGKLQHPLQREFAISLLYLYIRLQADDSTKEKLFAVPLFSMLSKLLFDPRSGRVLRDNIAAVILRVVGPTAEGRMKELMGKHVSDEWSRRTRKSQKRKRDAKGEGSRKYTHYRVQEQRAIGLVLSNLPEASPSSPKLLKMIPTLCRQSEKISASKNGWGGITKRSAESTALLLSVVAGLFRTTPAKKNAVARFQDAIGSSDITRLHRMAMSWPRTLCQWSSSITHVTTKEVVLLGSVLRHLRCVCAECEQPGQNGIPIQEICHLLAFCTELSYDHKDGDNENRRVVMFEAIALLGSLAMAIPPSCSEKLLQNLIGLFRRLLSMESWAVRAHAISSLQAFGASLHMSNHSMLKLCIPEAQMGLLQCRVQGLVLRDSKSCEVQQSFGAKYFTSHQQSISVSKRQHRRMIFPSVATSMTIPPGSYFIHMPTQDGRQALVVFPPGQQSLEDIRYMCGQEDDHSFPETKKLLRMVALKGGGGKCLLEES